MADLVVVDPNTTGSTRQPVPNTLSASDRFAATRGRKYMLRLSNAHSASQTLRVDDPTSQTPQNANQFDPDVYVPVPNGSAPANQRVITLDSSRFADANGWINLSFAVAPTTFTAEIYGPLPG